MPKGLRVKQVGDSDVHFKTRCSLRPVTNDAVFSEFSEIVEAGVYLMILECLRAPRCFHWTALRSAALRSDFVGLLHK